MRTLEVHESISFEDLSAGAAYYQGQQYVYFSIFLNYVES